MSITTNFLREDTSLFDDVEELLEDLYRNYEDLGRNCQDTTSLMVSLALDFINNESPHKEVFDSYNSEIKDGLMAHIKVGVYLSRIARKRLYQLAGIKSFKEYCTKHLNKTSAYCVRLIKAAKTTLQLMVAGFDRLPTNEAQCRPLTNITNNEELAAKWQEVLDRADKSSRNPKGVITATMISEVVNGEPEPVEKKSVKISARSAERLERLAKKVGKPVSELIDEAINKLDFYYQSEDEYKLQEEYEQELIECPQCGGTGEGEHDDCDLCHGEGLVTRRTALWYAEMLSQFAAISNKEESCHNEDDDVKCPNCGGEDYFCEWCNGHGIVKRKDANYYRSLMNRKTGPTIPV